MRVFLCAAVFALVVPTSACGSDGVSQEEFDASMAQIDEENARQEARREAEQRITDRLDHEYEVAFYAANSHPSDKVLRLKFDLARARSAIWRDYSYESNGYDCPPSRPVKGNVTYGRDGDRIYHLPQWAYYGPTIPESCFKTEDEAMAAGYRASTVR